MTRAVRAIAGLPKRFANRQRYTGSVIDFANMRELGR